MPYKEFYIDDEDSVSERIRNKEEKGTLDIAVIRLLHMSNFTDFSALDRIPGVTVRYVAKPNELRNPNLIIIPGTKNTIEDLRIIKENKLFNKIKELKESGTPIFGICGGYQMLGTLIIDKLGVEGDISQEEGFGFLDMKTRFNELKVTKQTKANILCDLNFIKSIQGSTINGYEIHNGISKIGKKIIPFITDSDGIVVGVCDKEKMVAGTYLHGIFDSQEFIKAFVDMLRENADIKVSKEIIMEKINEYKDKEYDKLAKVFEENIDINKLKWIMKI
jgi:adenosylcobyric acid synthase